MAFELTRWSRQSVALNTGQETVSADLYNGPAIFSYASDADTAAEIEAANYFADVVYELAVNDIIFAWGSDAFTARSVDAIDRAAGTVSTVSIGLNDSIATANIDNSAVTTAKIADDAVTNAKLAEDTIQTASVTIATGDVLTLATTPVELVAAPGADKYIQFLGAQLVLDYNSAAYTESGDNLGIKYTDAAGVQVSDDIECTGFIDQTADTITNAVPVKDAIVAASGAVNQALVLDNLGSNFAAGNSSLDVVVSYKVLTAGL
jgi:hypothetical protein